MEKILFLVLVFDILLIDIVNILILFFDSAFSVILVKVLVFYFKKIFLYSFYQYLCLLILVYLICIQHFFQIFS